jgi:succinate dehydrogenase / fumarate reductase flavoprotein subunit
MQQRARNLRVRSSERRYNPGWHLCADVRNLLVCSEAIARAALMRTESRGAHSRLDYPDPSPEWAGVNLVSSAKDGAMTLERRPLVTRPDLEQLVETRRAMEAQRPGAHSNGSPDGH